MRDICYPIYYGIRTSIKNINSVGHLIEGNIYTFLQQSISSEEMFRTNIDFLGRLIEKTSEYFYMSEKYWRELDYELNYLRHGWREMRHLWEDIRYDWKKYREKFDKFN